MVRLILIVVLCFSTNTFAQSWDKIEYFDKPIPVKFYKTKNSGKQPTVLLIHGTAGVASREENWAKFLSENNYNVAVVDFKTGRFSGPSDRGRVNYEALISFIYLWLKDHPNVDQNNIIYMGLSLGGFLGFYLDRTDLFNRYILFYPGCYHLINKREGLIIKERINPTLLIWGTSDSYGEGTYCPQVVNKMVGKVFSHSIPNAGHGFDGDSYIGSFLDSASPTGRASLEPNKDALNFSRQKVLEFLQLNK